MSSVPSQLRIEFFGIPRIRAGVSETVIDLIDGEIELGELLARLSHRFPRLSQECFSGGAIRPGFTANVNGRRFVSRSQDRLKAGETLLLFSSDAGG